MTNPVEILTNTLKLLEDKGLARGTFRNATDGSHCTLGAMMAVSGYLPCNGRLVSVAMWDSEFMQAAYAVHKAMYGCDATALAGLNSRALLTLNRITSYNDHNPDGLTVRAVRQARNELVAEAITNGSAPLPYELPASDGRESVGVS